MSEPPESGSYPPQGVPPLPPQPLPYPRAPYPGAAPQPPYGHQPPPYGQQPPPYGQQPPPYGQQPPPYGQQPPPYGQQPPAYGVPQPGFTAQQAYSAPQGQPGQVPYGQPAPGWSAPGGIPPQAPAQKSRAGLVVAVVAIVVVLIVAGGLAVFLNQTKPAVIAATTPSIGNKIPTSVPPKATPAATGTSATTATATGTGALTVTCSGKAVDSATFSATVPSGWACLKVSSGLMLNDASHDTMMMLGEVRADASTLCTALADNGINTKLPDTQWGGKTATTVSLAVSGTKVHQRCIALNGTVYTIMAVPIDGSYDQVVAGVDALTSSWIWK